MRGQSLARLAFSAGSLASDRRQWPPWRRDAGSHRLQGESVGLLRLPPLLSLLQGGLPAARQLIS